MKPFRISEYLRKYRTTIVSICLISGILCFAIIELFVQKYKAQAIISYNYSGAEDGYAPDGQDLDVAEIYSPNVIVEVMDNLNIDRAMMNADSLREAITIEPLYSPEMLELETAMLKSGKEYEKKTNMYLITFSSSVLSGKEFPRAVLNEFLDVYSKHFVEDHVNNGGNGTNDIKDIMSRGYDYFEITEALRTSVEANLQAVWNKAKMDDEFRSYNTGYGFYDVANELQLILNIEIPTVSAVILNDAITTGKEVLLAKYQAANADLDTQNLAYDEELERIQEAMDTYVTFMEDSGNTSITYEYILNQVSSLYRTDANGRLYDGDVSAEYDQLMQAYVDNRNLYQKNLIQKDFNDYITARFERRNVEDVESDAETETAIQALVDRVDNLYTIFYKTNDEFNEYLGPEYISSLSSTSVTEKVPVLWLTIGVVVLFGLLGCGICIIIGRVSDMVDYYAYTGHVDGLPNRAKLDRFLEEKGRKSLIDEYACVSFRLVNLHEVNLKFGREQGDAMIQDFAKVLTDVFEPSDKVFVANNGAGNYCVFAEKYTSVDVQEALQRVRRDIETCTEERQYSIRYTESYAVAADEKCYNVKELMLLAGKKLQNA